MTRHSDQVRLAPADWGGICSLALALASLAGATLYRVHDLAAENRVRQARIDLELGYLKGDVQQLQADVRSVLHHPPSGGR